MDNTKKNSNVPNLRFSDIEQNWVKYKVSDLLTCVPTNSLTWNELSYDEESSLKNIHYGLIHNGFTTTCILCDNKLIPYVNTDSFPKQYRCVEKGDLILADASEDRKDVGRAVEIIDTKNEITISGLHTIHAKNISNLFKVGYKGYYFNSIAMKKQIHRIANGSKIYSISPSNFNELYISIPNKHEQAKIVSLLSLIEQRIETQIKIIEDFELLKKEISNQIFSVLHKFPTGIVEDYICYEQPQKYIVNSTEYIERNKHTIPVLTANQAFILGYTNEINGIYNKGSCIIIDDFTLNCKYVDFDFKIKSSAIKILKGSDTILTKFFYEYLKFLNLSTEEHKRHYISEVSKLPINVPPLSQQNLIVNKLDLFSQKIEHEKAILNLYKEQKNYLLNNMFI